MSASLPCFGVLLLSSFGLLISLFWIFYLSLSGFFFFLFSEQSYKESGIIESLLVSPRDSCLFSVVLQREEGRCRVQVQVDLNFKLKIYLNLKISSQSLPKFQLKIWNFSFRARKREFLKSCFSWIFPMRNVDFP